MNSTYPPGTYTAAQMMEIALDHIRGMTMKKCLTCSKAYKDEWVMPNAEAPQHKDRFPKHVIVDAEKPKKGEKTK